jgi:hypothetical protein
VSPRRGGETDKFGNRYEGRWTVRQVLDILQGEALAITIEPIGEIGEGVEFSLERTDVTEVHQVKRQIGTANEWELHVLNSRGVLAAAQKHVAAGRQFHFVSTTSASLLGELADRARRSGNLQSFEERWLTSQDLTNGFKYLKQTAYDSAQTAWTTLCGLYVRCTDELSLLSINHTVAGLLLAGAAPPLAVAGLGDLVSDHLAEQLDARVIEDLLKNYGLRLQPITGSPTIRESVRSISAGWSESVDRELLRPTIPRSEAETAVDHLMNDPGRRFFVMGDAGTGKSAVLHQIVGRVESANWPVLAVRLDRVELFSSTVELGQRRGLDMSPVTALAAVAGERPCLLVVDQLDAVSLASGRLPTDFDAVADLVREASAFPAMRVLLACRKFDLNNDYRIRALTESENTRRIEVGPLSDEQVDAAIRAMKLPAEQLTSTQRDLFRTPLHLVLLGSIADQADALSITSPNGLFRAYWERKRSDCRRRQPTIRFVGTIDVIAEAMSDRQRLSVPETVLDTHDLAEDAQVLASEGVLVRDGRQLAFFHQAFFDYAFARRWVSRKQALAGVLRSTEQELFRRSQVRQILAYLRDEDHERFVTEVETVLSDPVVRFHIKEIVLASLRSLTDPTAAEWAMIARLIATGPPFASQLWVMLRILPWFDRLDAEQVIEQWLASDVEADHYHALDIMLGGVTERLDRLAELLAPHAGRAAGYPIWLNWITRFGDMYQSRPLFDLVLAAIRRGDYEGQEQGLWLATSGRAQRQPAWAVELLAAYLADQPGAWDLDDVGSVKALRLREHSAIELVSQSAAGAPAQFCQLLVPYLLKVMALTEDDPQTLPIADRQFSRRLPNNGPFFELDDALLSAAVTAIRALVEHDPLAAQPVLEQLAADPHDSAQWLLYEGLRAAGERYAAWAAMVLLEGTQRLVSGYPENPVWTTRELLQSITPYPSGEVLAQLEQAVMEYRPSWERPASAGFASYTLLSGMAEDRLSEAARKRLGELRRRFDSDQPPTPLSMQGGFVRSPIPEATASHMTDEQWLDAMNRYTDDRTDFVTLTGGARELSHVLRTEVTAHPARFARLALRMTNATHPAYGNAVLQALADTKEPIDPALVFDVLRHIASLRNEEYQDWLGWPLRRYLDGDVPDDIILIILDRALHAVSPTEDRWTDDDGREPPTGGAIWMAGLNSARGQSVVILGDLLLHDKDGHRTALIVPSLDQLASDLTVAVRCCVGHLLMACLRHARAEAIAAFQRLIATDDRLLATDQVLNLMIAIGLGDASAIEPVTWRMLGSTYPKVRESAAMIAAFAGLELGLGHLLITTRDSHDAATRKGAARLCARRLSLTASAPAAADALQRFLGDDDEGVRKAAAEVAVHLRGRALRPFFSVLMTLIVSPAFSESLPQLLLTLQQAPDRINGPLIQCTRRFLDLHSSEIGNIATAAAGEARDVGQLVLRAYAQAPDRASRATVLDLIDELLLAGAYDFAQAVNEAER